MNTLSFRLNIEIPISIYKKNYCSKQGLFSSTTSYNWIAFKYNCWPRVNIINGDGTRNYKASDLSVHDLETIVVFLRDECGHISVGICTYIEPVHFHMLLLLYFWHPWRFLQGCWRLKYWIITIRHVTQWLNEVDVYNLALVLCTCVAFFYEGKPTHDMKGVRYT